MKKIILILSLSLVACSESKKQDILVLNTFKDKLSYTLGADHARAISESGDKNFNKYDLEEIVKGFKEGIKNEKAFDENCKATMKKLFGQSGTDFNKNYVKDGSNCIGKISGMFFTSGWKPKRAFDKINMEKVIIGFEHGLRKIDTIVPKAEQSSMIQNFIADLNKQNGIKMMENAKKLKNTKTTKSGIVLQTLSEGNGGSPASGDDVLAHYILMNALGDTLQSSFKMVELYKQPLNAFSLLSVVPGWQEGFPMMKKGGKYKLYIPFHLAYGEAGMFNPQTQSYDIQPYESLVFYIELINYGKPGSLSNSK